ncbi:hypothetical protein B0T17DRAFT_533012 [Bombardia bombarda]|uniref:FAD/NAD(P)-binding domain-containing protein n=1 Tax=Bombardia bombarda TaxID=252184 RepID=A0AA39X1N6_9PEZI|nr:hypothetical protein B0T17DRAFT_533012 [Bombardia bombarda]
MPPYFQTFVLGLVLISAILVQYYLALQRHSGLEIVDQENMIESLRNVIVLGGSYVGVNAAKELANLLPVTHRVLLVEPHSHFHHLFAFPRFAVLPGHEHKAFIPYSSVFSSAPGPDASRHQVIKARAVSLQPKQLTLDREWQGSRDLAFDYLVAATGTRLAPPGSMEQDDKATSVAYLKNHQRDVQKAKSIVVIGGGAVGCQLVTDLKEVYPEKDITLVHSRQQLMPVYHEGLSNLIKQRLEELGVHLVAGSRAIVPSTSFSNHTGDESSFHVELEDGRAISTDFAIFATGQIPNNQFLASLEKLSTDSLVNPKNGFIRVRPNLQFQDPLYPHLFAVGDIADSGAHKAARPGAVQAKVAAMNIAALVGGRGPSETITVSPPGIHLSLGLTRNVIFRNPNLAAGETEPFINLKDDGRDDMNIESVWERRGVAVTSPQEYHL